MNLPGAPALPFELHVADVAFHHANLRRAFAEALEIDLERARSKERTQRAEAIANAAEEDREFRTSREFLAALEFGRRKEIDADCIGARGRRDVQRKRDRP